MQKRRLDQYLEQHYNGLSRSQAKLVIKKGEVLVNGQVATKPSMNISEEDIVTWKESEKKRYVGRGGEKLEHALQVFDLSVKERVAIDIGSSTGGFTDCFLQQGVKRVIAVDVGQDQMHEKLRQHPSVELLESTDIRMINPLDENIEVASIDVSFISSRLILEHLKQSIQRPIEIILLFKPQFEAGSKEIKRCKGVIKSEEVKRDLLSEFREWCQEVSIEVLGDVPSPILGKKGNEEFLFFLRVNPLEKLC